MNAYMSPRALRYIAFRRDLLAMSRKIQKQNSETGIAGFQV